MEEDEDCVEKEEKEEQEEEGCGPQKMEAVHSKESVKKKLEEPRNICAEEG